MDLISWWAEHQSHCEKNMWDGINMLLQPSLERMIHCIWSVYSKASVHERLTHCHLPTQAHPPGIACCLRPFSLFLGLWLLLDASGPAVPH